MFILGADVRCTLTGFDDLISGGYMKSSGVMYLKFKDKFQQSAVMTAWVFSLYYIIISYAR